MREDKDELSIPELLLETCQGEEVSIEVQQAPSFDHRIDGEAFYVKVTDVDGKWATEWKVARKSYTVSRVRRG